MTDCRLPPIAHVWLDDRRRVAGTIRAYRRSHPI